jgi:hypothetical protein
VGARRLFWVSANRFRQKSSVTRPITACLRVIDGGLRPRQPTRRRSSAPAGSSVAPHTSSRPARRPSEVVAAVEALRATSMVRATRYSRMQRPSPRARATGEPTQNPSALCAGRVSFEPSARSLGSPTWGKTPDWRRGKGPRRPGPRGAGSASRARLVGDAALHRRPAVAAGLGLDDLQDVRGDRDHLAALVRHGSPWRTTSGPPRPAPRSRR